MPVLALEDSVPRNVSSSKTAKPETDTIAVIDAGSNKFRMVVFDVSGDESKVIHEAKATPALAKGTRKGHRHLDDESKAFALDALKRFRSTLEGYERQGKTMEVYVLGTAALRAVKRTKDGRDFLQHASETLGHTISVITGMREAILTGLGIRARNPNARGVFAGIGGGSIELGFITKKGNIKEPDVINIGALSLMEESRKGRDPIEELERNLSRRDFGEVKTLHVTGGDWRAIGRIISGRLEEKGVPNKFPDQLTLRVEDARAVLNAIATKGLTRDEKQSHKISDRAPHIPVSALALISILNHVKPEKITFSKASIREGIVEARARGQSLASLRSEPVAAARLSSPERPKRVLRASMPLPGYQKVPDAIPA